MDIQIYFQQYFNKTYIPIEGNRNMLFYGDKPNIDYVTAARSTLKNYNTFITQDNKPAFDPKTKHQVQNQNTIMHKHYQFSNKQNNLHNCKSTINIQLPIESSAVRRDKSRCNSYLNKSQVQTRNDMLDGSYYNLTPKKSTKSRWELAEYTNENYNQNYNTQFNMENMPADRSSHKKSYGPPLMKSKSINNAVSFENYQQKNTGNQYQQIYHSYAPKSTGLHFQTYNLIQPTSPTYKKQQKFNFDYKQQYSKSSSKGTSKNQPLPLYERVKILTNDTPSFKQQQKNRFMHSTVSYLNSEIPQSNFISQSLGQTKYRPKYDNYQYKIGNQQFYSTSRSINNNVSPRNLAKSMVSKAQFLKQPELNDFIIGDCKGEGRFGKVYMVIHKKTGFLCALKKIKKQSVKYMMDQFIQQVKIQLFLNHPKLVKIFGYFADEQYFYMLVQYMEQGSLYSLMKKNKKLEQNEAASKLKQICLGIKEMHDNNIVHRDLKPQNVVMTMGICKICDFGWAAICENRRQTYCGTLDYVCPQIVQGNEYDSSADIWCIGVLAYQLMCGKAPFYDISRQKTIQKIKQCKIDNFPAHLSKVAVKFIQMILKKNPYSRVGIKQLLDSQFLKSVKKQ